MTVIAIVVIGPSKVYFQQKKKRVQGSTHIVCHRMLSLVPRHACAI